ncbi:tumor necrosis factor ligand superfamily member 6-like [Mizuhopecten yessoensis]|uniref:Tumor necrosis factor ligand superfamily member 10 n=1 Tax=Mizuhopecten yessoensis TaxID=6573 RepID=A0A210QXX8_MIZYE|nr:tumor necrosis factor ligand superfamily member 6-like [Mizuhopecten yessoensis]XP_021346928.1 tumor necrosis factor ligand superfamily member 6-like [Mizuhopecten yessoensis]OWF53600.1 Tumor necrosis factor ligand superfamily member 10 [Mizuhopecten yessoensis]
MEPCPSIQSMQSIQSTASSSVLVPDVMHQHKNGNVSQRDVEGARVPDNAMSTPRRVLLLASSAVVFLLVLLTSLVVILFMQVTNLRNTLNSEIYAHSKDFGEVCLPCGELQMGPFEEDTPDLVLLEKVRSDEGDICCAKSPNQTKILFELLYQKKKMQEYRHDMLKSEHHVDSAPKINTVSAHLLVSGVQPPVADKSSGRYPIKNWSKDHVIANITGISFQPDRLRINTSGLYFIYSQVYFDRMCDQVTQEANKPYPIYHYVYRFNVIYPNGGEQLLMKSVRTPCWTQQKALHGDYTSYTAAAIRMAAGDEIYVMVSNISMVSPVPEASFLGVFKIS